MSVPDSLNLRADAPYTVLFDNTQAGALSTVSLEDLQVVVTGGVDLSSLRLRARIFDPLHPEEIAQAEAPLPGTGKLDKLELSADTLPRLDAGRRYGLALEIVQATGEAAGEAPAAETGINVRVGGAVKLNLYGKTDTASYLNNNGELVNLMLPKGGTLRQLRLPVKTPLDANAPLQATVILKDAETGEQQVVSGNAQAGSPDGLVRLEPSAELKPGVTYLTAVTISPALDANQTIQLNFLDQPVTQALPVLVPLARPDAPLSVSFSARQNGQLKKVRIPHAAQVETSGSPTGLTLALYRGGNLAEPIRQVHLDADLTPGKDPRGSSLTFDLNEAVDLKENDVYSLSLTPDHGAVAVRGSATANESTWDMGLPFRIDNYDPYGGIYRGDLNFEMYWDDNAEKRQRFINILDQADDIFMSSNRQWGTTTRLPMRHPLTTEFYRRLLGCPTEQDVEWCYRVAEPGMFQGDLGFDLIKVVSSYPNLGPVKINDQFAEEAFTVYDHSKVMIFQKRADYDSARAQAILNAVDLDNVVRVTPKKAGAWKDLLLSAQTWATQRAGGTWAALFPPAGRAEPLPGGGAGGLVPVLAGAGRADVPAGAAGAARSGG